jgi:hypothetical protein
MGATVRRLSARGKTQICGLQRFSNERPAGFQRGSPTLDITPRGGDDKRVRELDPDENGANAAEGGE